jgi:hypothetical protein
VCSNWENILLRNTESVSDCRAYPFDHALVDSAQSEGVFCWDRPIRSDEITTTKRSQHWGEEIRLFLHILKEKAHEVTRGMNPTVPETVISERVMGCATESGVRICTPPRG